MSKRQANIGKSVSSTITSKRYPGHGNRRVVRIQFKGVVFGSLKELNTFIYPVIEDKKGTKVFRGYAVATIPDHREMTFEEFFKSRSWGVSPFFKIDTLPNVIKQVRSKIRETELEGLFWTGRQAISEERTKATTKQIMCPPREADGTLAISPEAIKYVTECNNRQPQTKELWTKNGIYVAERKKLHEKIIEQFKSQKPCIVKGKPVAILTGGPPGSGKSFFIKNFAPWMLSGKMFHVDADEIRSKLPEYEGWNADRTHLETKDIVNKMLDSIGKPCKVDLLYDGTMNTARSYIPLLTKLRRMGYDVFVIYVQVPKKVSIERVKKRYQETGRMVPLEVVEDIYEKGTKAFREVVDLSDGFIRVDGMNGKVVEKGGKDFPRERQYEELTCPDGKEDCLEEQKEGCGDPKKDPFADYEYQIEFLNKDNRFKPETKVFDTEEKARKWGRENLENFSVEMIRMVKKKPEKIIEAAILKETNKPQKKGRVAFGREITIKLPNGEQRKGQFAVVEASDIIASHDEETFNSSKGYPVDANGDNINDRNYATDKNLQGQVIKYAAELDPERVVTTSRTASGTPIIDKNGIVVSGNNRTMSIKRAIERHPEKYQAYKDFLADEADAFDIDRDEIDAMKNPVLVRYDFDIPALNTAELAKYNKDTKKGESPVDKAVKISKQLATNVRCRERIGAIISEYERMSDFYANAADQRALMTVLESCDIITDQERPTYFDGGFTSAGKELVENVMAGIVLNKKSLTVANNTAKSTRQIIVTSLPVLVANSQTEAPLIDDLNEAVEIEGKVRSSGLPFEKWVMQGSMFGDQDSARGMVMNRLLATGRNNFKGAIEKYNKGLSDAKADMFGDAPTTEDVYQAYIVGEVPPKEVEIIEKATGTTVKKKSDDVRKKPEPEPKPEKKNGPEKTKETGLSSTVKRIASTAWQGISFSPERRANTFVKDYENLLRSDLRELEAIPEAKRRIDPETYERRFNEKLASYLATKSRTISPMITGPARFPVARNNKIMDVEMRKYQDFEAWRERVLTPKELTFNAETADEMIAKLRQKIRNMERSQELMKQTNVIYRKFKKDPSVIDQPGIDPFIVKAIRQHEADDRRYSFEMGKVFQSYALTNNNNTIKRSKERLAELEGKVANIEKGPSGKIEVEAKIKGQEVTFEVQINPAMDRIQLFFDGKPSREVIEYVKKRGFKWAPSQKAWQRQNTPNGRSVLRQMIIETTGSSDIADKILK